MEECVVIGAGLIGMLTARELASHGFKVTLFDRGDAGRESSWAGGGILSPLYPWRYPEAVSRLAVWGHRNYQVLTDELYSESGIDPEWTKSGLLILDTEERDQAIAWAERFSMHCDVIGRDDIQAIEPSLFCPDGQEALWMPDVAQVRNPRIVQALKKSVLGKKIQLIENKEVIGIEQKGGQITGVTHVDGFLPADKVVVASGAWSAHVLDSFGVDIKVEPVRGQMILFRTEPGLIKRIVLKNGHYLIPRRDGRVLMGSTLEYVGFDKSTTEEAFDELYQLALEMVPFLRNYDVEKHWAGLRPGSLTGVPYIGKVPGVEGLFINTGHFRNGVILGPGSVQLLVDIMLEREPLVDPSEYALR